MSITSESWWGREVNAPALVTLGEKIRIHYKLTAGAIGIKGNTAHTQGYHRSANWVRNSAYSTSGSYSVTETPGNRNPANADWCCALDITLPHDELLAACKRLDAAVRAGRLEKVTEWYGNDDGDNRVDGYDNIRNRVASSDNSHLWHMHMSFDRKRVAEDHTDVFEILTGASAMPVGLIGLEKGMSGKDGRDVGDAVKSLQLMLRACGHYKGEVSGVYDAATVAAVLKCRQAEGSAVNGPEDADRIDSWTYTQVLQAFIKARVPAGPPGPPLAVGTVLALDVANATVTAVTPPA